MQCPVCHNEVAPQTAFCNHCGASLATAAPAYSTVPTEAAPPPPPVYSQVPAAPPPAGPAAAGGFSPNAASALSYVFLVPAIFFLAIEPYNKNPLVRFHSFQSIGLFIVSVAIWICFYALQTFLRMFVGSFFLFAMLLGLLELAIFFGLFIVWVFTVLKALKGEWFKLPFIGDFAEKQARS